MSKGHKITTSVDVVERFELFVSTFDELIKLKYAQLTDDLQINFEISSKKPMVVETSGLGDEEEFRSFLLTFRKFFLQTDGIEINRIYQDCVRHFTNETWREYIIDARDQWKKRQKITRVPLPYKGRFYTPAEIFDKWVAYFFHTNTVAQTFIRSLTPDGRRYFEYQLHEYVQSALGHLQYLADAIATNLAEGNVSNVPIPRPSTNKAEQQRRNC